MPEPAAPVQAAFVLPQTFPVTVNTLNYAGVAVGIVMLAALLFWFLPFGLGARRWFRGEIKTAKIPFDSVRLRFPQFNFTSCCACRTETRPSLKAVIALHQHAQRTGIC